MRKSKTRIIVTLLTILSVTGAIVFSFVKTSPAQAFSNETFKQFNRSSYPKITLNKAKEIAYYSDYILPLISEPSGCLGSRPYDPNVLKNDQANSTDKDNRIYHINRCSQLHASDYARLNYIVALNANLAVGKTKSTALRYVDPTNENDGFNLLMEIGSCGDSATVSCFLPSASGYGMTHKQLSQIMIPGVNLYDTNIGNLFGFTRKDGKIGIRDFANYNNMYYDVINYALRDCGQSTASSIIVEKDKVTNDRAILLNEDTALGSTIQDRLNKLNECKKTCQDTQEEDESNFRNCVGNMLAAGWKNYIDSKSSEFQNYYYNHQLKIDNRLKEISDKIIDDINFNLLKRIEDCAGKEKNCFGDKLPEGPDYLTIYHHLDAMLLYIADDTYAMNLFVDQYNKPMLLEFLAGGAIDHLNSTAQNLKPEGTCLKPGVGTNFESAESCEKDCDNFYGMPTEISSPTCATLVAILKQTDYPDDASYFINNLPAKWLPLTDDEKLIMGYDVKDLSPNKGGNSVTYHPEKSVNSTCHFTGISALICTITNFLTQLADSAFHIIESLLAFPAELLNPKNGSSDYNLYSTWKAFRDVANIILIIMLLVVTLSQISGWRIDQWGIKRNLPKIIVAAILVNVSFIICQIVVDLSNLIGKGTYDLFKSGSNALLQIPSTAAVGQTATSPLWSKIALYAIGVSLGLAIIYFIIILAPSLIAALVTATMTVLILVLRQVFIVILIIMAPIAFAIAATSSTESVSKKWWSALFGILIAYPLVSMAFGIGNLTYSILTVATPAPLASEGDTASVLDLLSMVLLFLPLMLVPNVLKKSIQKLPFIGGKLNNLTQNWSKRAKGATENSKLVTTTKFNRAQKARIRSFKRAQWLGRDKHVGNLTIPGIGLYRDAALGAQVDQEWLEDVRSRKYYDANGNPINGENNVNQIREFNSGSGYKDDQVMAAMLTAADEGEGYFEDVIIAANKLSHQVEPEKLSAIMNEVIQSYQENGRTEVAALLQHAQQSTGGTYQLTKSANANHGQVLNNFNKTIAASANNNPSEADIAAGYKNVVKGAMTRSKGINYSKFKGIDTDDKANSKTGRFYGDEIIKSSGYARDAIDDLVKNNPYFADEVKKSIPSSNKGVSKARAFFEDDVSRGGLGHKLWG